MSGEVLQLYLSLEPENRQKVDAVIQELVSAEEARFLGMANSPDSRAKLLPRLNRLGLLPGFLAAEGGREHG